MSLIGKSGKGKCWGNNRQKIIFAQIIMIFLRFLSIFADSANTLVKKETEVRSVTGYVQRPFLDRVIGTKNTTFGRYL